MALSDPFNFTHSKFVASIVCMECGGNAHIVRRESRGSVEAQTFQCSECGVETQRLRGEADSDESVQREAEQRSGVGAQAIKMLAA